MPVTTHSLFTLNCDTYLYIQLPPLEAVDSHREPIFGNNTTCRALRVVLILYYNL